MNPLHVVVSLANLFFGLLFIALLYFQPSPGFAFFSEAGGLALNALAVFVTVVITILLAFHMVRGSARTFLAGHWLGLFNGLFVVACWVGFFNAAKFFRW